MQVGNKFRNPNKVICNKKVINTKNMPGGITRVSFDIPSKDWKKIEKSATWSDFMRMIDPQHAQFHGTQYGCDLNVLYGHNPVMCYQNMQKNFNG